jgi:AhpD family alkylhydroperoxidase
MSERLDYSKQSPEILNQYFAFSAALDSSAIERSIRDLVNIRVSQLNGCAFCLDMHSKEAKIHGERELRLYHVAIWRESNLFSPRERACLAWAEVLTRLPEGGVPEATYQAARQQLSEKEITDLSFCVLAINGWNRLSIGFTAVPGSKDALFGLTKAGLS